MSTESTFVIELAEGHLAIHDLTVGAARPDAPVVLAAHGITANGLSWQRVADEVDRRHGSGAVRFLAPDLRGRGDSRSAPGPYGLRVHADDLASIASVFAAAPVLVGHSMGAFVAALAADLHPDRFTGVVLVDGGLAFPVAPDLDIDATLKAVIGPAMDRLSMRFADPQAYLDFWAQHPALGPVLRGPGGEAARRYIEHDLVDDGVGQWRSTCVLEAVRADGADVLADPQAHAAVRHLAAKGVPVELLWARRGLLDEPQGLYDPARLAALDVPEQVRVTEVDANHYDIVLGDTAVADAIDRQLGA
ncbi:alpha/beta hydrolase [Humibacillus xanthopallidus]|uniref:Pimeloyl-ACP methyl ester carboxylesterase n=1 Tax=Humibacillus xanthopallidus TaxID=412689 RepID=A0A543HHH9_9MICO|nr:alpha/beta hydrolase [Humibacillus xanthopallidus]TQM57782.1 pimeloyl-ACP methyl ester carboxylesterase [Humibacillus xanthopallidus]